MKPSSVTTLAPIAHWLRLAVAGFLLLALSIAAHAQNQVAPSDKAASAPERRLEKSEVPLPVTSDGRDFAKLTEKEVDGLSRPEKKRYYEWENARLDAMLSNLDKELKSKDAVLSNLDKEIQRKNLIIVREYEIMIKNFTILQNSGNTSEKIYSEMKVMLREVLNSREYPELMPKLEPLRSILNN